MEAMQGMVVVALIAFLHGEERHCLVTSSQPLEQQVPMCEKAGVWGVAPAGGEADGGKGERLAWLHLHLAEEDFAMALQQGLDEVLVTHRDPSCTSGQGCLVNITASICLRIRVTRVIVVIHLSPAQYVKSFLLDLSVSFATCCLYVN